MTLAPQYLRLQLNGTGYLLPNTVSYAIEQRDALMPNASGGNVSAWRTVRQGRWPAYGLDAALKVARGRDWQRAIFLESGGRGVGLIVDDVQMLGRSETQVARFTPIGPPATPHGHLFIGAWLDGRNLTLVIEPKILIAYLQGLGD